MLASEYKKLLPEHYSDEEKNQIVNDLIILSGLILDSEDLLKVVNKRTID